VARIFITGSSDGLGQLAANALVAQGHDVVLHARNEKRGEEAMDKVPGAEAVVTADLADLDATKALAANVNALGTFDAIIHNAGAYRASPGQIFPVNTLAPYILTCLIEKPERLVYLSSSLHLEGHFRPESFTNDVESISYSDTKLHVLMLAKAVARRWPDVYSNALDPGWVPTKMGGENAPDDLQKGYETQVWLATSNDAEALVSGNYFRHQKVTRHNPEADDVDSQERLLSLCGEITGVSFP
jgi:NAD(P)-dependent dehydrogenase (short-subunit alcohol dehydrogenase family)